MHGSGRKYFCYIIPSEIHRFIGEQPSVRIEEDEDKSSEVSPAESLRNVEVLGRRAHLVVE